MNLVKHYASTVLCWLAMVLFCIGFIVFVTACTPEIEIPAPSTGVPVVEGVTVELLSSSPRTYRVVDGEFGVVCYVVGFVNGADGGISCLEVER